MRKLLVGLMLTGFLAACSASPDDGSSPDGGTENDAAAQCEDRSFTIQLVGAGNTCVYGPDPLIANRSVSFYFDWGPDVAFDPVEDVVLEWQGLAVPFQEPFVEGYDTLEGCSRSGTELTPERPLAPGKTYLLRTRVPDNAVAGTCPGIGTGWLTFEIEVEGEDPYLFCGDDRPDCTSDAECPTPWVCAEEDGRCYLTKSPTCEQFGDPAARCRELTGAADSECVSCPESERATIYCTGPDAQICAVETTTLTDGTCDRPDLGS